MPSMTTLQIIIVLDIEPGDRQPSDRNIKIGECR